MKQGKPYPACSIGGAGRMHDVHPSAPASGRKHRSTCSSRAPPPKRVSVLDAENGDNS